ncbi:hypothetical protein VP01_1095g9 [Puccinia sorghi]|uniref:Trehalose-phosphatase n=1 Tax=Puccinia sorghi TaxID=27349 RepID=A0A0L6VTB0_9BASI|nr:hypothetical protein VP01_1095g9 [Puccinia sorghi]
MWVVPRAERPSLDHWRTSKDFKEHRNKLVILDYDGTMVPFHDTPESAVPGEPLLEVLDKLERDPTTYVAIITGRDEKFVQKHFGKYSSFHLSAEYGAKERKPGGEWRQVEGLDLSWLRNVQDMMENVEEFFLFLDRQNKLKKLGSKELKVENDNLAIEVRMGEALSKGHVVEKVLGSLPNTDMVLCFGDSESDEDMFRALRKMKESGMQFPHVLTTVHVDNGKGYKTIAQHKMRDPKEFIDLFRMFYGIEH